MLFNKNDIRDMKRTLELTESEYDLIENGQELQKKFSERRAKAQMGIENHA